MWEKIELMAVSARPFEKLSSLISKAKVSQLIQYIWLIFLVLFCETSLGVQYRNNPLTCDKSTLKEPCKAYLHYYLYATVSAKEVAKYLFKDQMNSEAIYVNETENALLIGVDCFCTEESFLLAQTNFSVGSYPNMSSDAVQDIYKGLAWIPSEEIYQENSTVSIKLPCMCDDTGNGYWKYLTYAPRNKDVTSDLVLQFGSNLTLFLALNNLSSKEDPLIDDKIYYFPVKEVYGDPLNAAVVIPEVVNKKNKKGWSKVVLIVGLAAGGLILSIALIAGFILRGRFKWRQKNSSRYLKRRFKPQNIVHSTSNSDFQLSLSKETNNLVDPEKMICFKFEEVVTGTSRFSESNFVAHSWYGSSYTACLRNQQFDVKKIRLAPSKLTPEFLKEVKKLRKLHHTNLASLIGYASNEDELLLVYESSKCGPLSTRLHDPASKGLTPMNWNERLQIAIDIARGLEYIHDDTQLSYVHCDINGCSMLLEDDVQGKVGEFGLSKLLEIIGSGCKVTNDITKLAFMAPEFLSGGRSTVKSDVYSFGVVLFELLTGQRAIADSQNDSGQESPLSLATSPVTLRTLKKTPRPLKINQIRNWVDPNLYTSYPESIFCKTAEIAQRCLDENPSRRPNVREIVYSLSRILLESIEWDGALAGGSQVFSGLRHGR
ncbi:hypothetical protein SUGI_0485020 [Cryptomeria japonica]|nr:hypothetical protein SUGI_0485020 [Cryptomeria japonica]